MSLYLHVEVVAGETIANAATEAMRLARHLDINVQFKFNDVTCVAGPCGNAKTLVERFHAAVSIPGRPHKFAHST